MAGEKFKSILKPLRQKYADQMLDSSEVQLIFPLKSKNYRAVGGKGKGFYARQFNLFDHSISKSHPAHDIFIYDLNRDCKDDNDNQYVDVVAVNSGEVIAVENNWQEGDAYKGGNYVWFYDYQTGGLWYYAHLREVYVSMGQKIHAGDKIGEVGRTGFNALTNRSDTHLHLMHLSLDTDLNPRPINHYEWLKSAQTVYTAQIPENRSVKDVEVFKLQSKSLNDIKLAGKNRSKDIARKTLRTGK